MDSSENVKRTASSLPAWILHIPKTQRNWKRQQGNHHYTNKILCRHMTCIPECGPGNFIHLPRTCPSCLTSAWKVYTHVQDMCDLLAARWGGKYPGTRCRTVSDTSTCFFSKLLAIVYVYRKHIPVLTYKQFWSLSLHIHTRVHAHTHTHTHTHTMVQTHTHTRTHNGADTVLLGAEERPGWNSQIF